MKKTATLAILLALSGQAYAQAAVTVDGHAACRTEKQLDDFIKFLLAEDSASAQAYLERQWCIALNPGITVTVTDSAGFLGSRVGFVFHGIKFWAPREAVEYK